MMIPPVPTSMKLPPSQTSLLAWPERDVVGTGAAALFGHDLWHELSGPLAICEHDMPLLRGFGLHNVWQLPHDEARMGKVRETSLWCPVAFFDMTFLSG
jgi:hypothetical protein